MRRWNWIGWALLIAGSEALLLLPGLYGWVAFVGFAVPGWALLWGER